MKKVSFTSALLVVLLGAAVSARAQEQAQDQQDQDTLARPPKYVFVMTDPEAIALKAEAARVAGEGNVRQLAVVPPQVPEAAKMGLAFAEVSTREVYQFFVGVSIFMALHYVLGDDEKAFGETMTTVTKAMETLGYDEEVIQKARSILRKGTQATTRDLLLLAAEIGIKINDPRESLAFGVGTASGTLLLGMSLDDSSIIMQAHSLLKQLTANAREMGIDNPIVALGRDLVRLTAENPISGEAVGAAFERRMREMGLRLL